MESPTSFIVKKGSLPILSANLFASEKIWPTIPDTLLVTARTPDGVVMGVRHRHHEVEGVQFHPESILTAHGHHLVRNFLDRAS